MDGNEFRKIDIVIEALRRHRTFQQLVEGVHPFIIYRADTGAVLAKGVYGFENAKAKANELRKKYNLKWENVKFKAEKKPNQKKTYSGYQSKRYETASRYNPSKRTYFRGGYDKDGNYYDID